MINPIKILIDWADRAEMRDAQIANELEEMRELGDRVAIEPTFLPDISPTATTGEPASNL